MPSWYLHREWDGVAAESNTIVVAALVGLVSADESSQWVISGGGGVGWGELTLSGKGDKDIV